MSALEKAKQDLVAALAELLPEEAAPQATDLAAPPNPKLGDLAFGCFGAAKVVKKSPAEVAKELAAKYEPSGLIASAAAAGPYLNFRFDRAAFAAALRDDILEANETFGRQPLKGEKIMIEYAQPNTHKEFHVGHLRNVCLGQSVVNLCRAAGFNVVPVSYMGDIGAHVAKCLWALKKFHANDPVPANRGKYLGQIYAEATRRIEEPELPVAGPVGPNPDAVSPVLDAVSLGYREEVAEVQRKLEARDPEWNGLWLDTRQWSIDEFREIFAELGIELDRWYFESEVEEPGKKLVRELLARGIAKEGERGAIIVDLEKYGLGIFLVLKSDGSSLYATKELALAQLKFGEYKDVSRSIHVVDSRQSLYFKQFFKTLELMGFDKLKTTHLAYEFVTLKEGAMSSRKGNIVAYEDFRDEMKERAAAETRKRRTEWGEDRLAQTAWAVAESAMKFGMLKQDPDKPIVFDIDAALSFDGFTGPYVQYAHARLSSILAKAGEPAPDKPAKGPVEPAEAEFAALAVAARFPEVVAEAAASYKPSVLAQYLFDLAQASNDFYRDVPVLAADAAHRGSRLRTVRALRAVLADGLGLLAIKAPDEM